MAILHRTRTLSALMPRYVERFRCLGSACEDTCCAGWSIHIDKKTYKAYRQNTAPELSRVLASSLVREDDDSNPAKYATIRTEGEERTCPLMQGGLCAIHKQLGESYISDLCFAYPRVTRLFTGQVEQALTLSCPEAARQALLAEDAFEFIEAPLAVRDAIVLEMPSQHGIPVEAMNEVRIFCLNLVRTRELALWQRLSALGLFCTALARQCADGQQAAIPALIENFVRLLESGELQASLDATTPNHAAQAMVFAVLWSANGFDSPSPYQQEVIRQISRGLGANDAGQASGQELAAAYVNGLVRLDEVLREDAPYLLENYLANEVFMHMVPFDTQDIYDSFLRLASRFCLLRLLLAAQANAAERVPVSTLVATVHLVGRRFQHDRAYNDRVNRALRESGWADLDKLQSLLRS